MKDIWPLVQKKREEAEANAKRWAYSMVRFCLVNKDVTRDTDGCTSYECSKDYFGVFKKGKGNCYTCKHWDRDFKDSVSFLKRLWTVIWLKLFGTKQSSLSLQNAQLVMNRKFWDILTPEQVKSLRNSGADVSVHLVMNKEQIEELKNSPDFVSTPAK